MVHNRCTLKEEDEKDAKIPVNDISGCFDYRRDSKGRQPRDNPTSRNRLG
jgi:hypothetical protein